MRNYILIISILTIIMVFIVIYLSDYIKGTYFADCREDFKDAISIISGAAAAAHENFDNEDVKNEYDRRVEARRTDFYEKTGTGTDTAVNRQEVSLGAQTEFYNNGLYDKYSSINDPIGDEYLPYTVKNYKDDPAAITTNNMNEYTIINVYKNILDRQPTDLELRKNLQDFYENDMDESILKLRIYNSAEFKIITNMQSNDIKPELITNLSKGQLKDKLIGFYKDQHDTILINTKLIDILIKCYTHLQFNDYLFRAMLMHDNYMKFENMLRNEIRLSDEKILEIFNKSFILYELRLIANELKRQDVLKRKALQIPVSLYNNKQGSLGSLSSLDTLNTSNINMGAAKNIADIVRNSDNIFNINIMVKDPNTKTTMPYSQNIQRRPSSQSSRQGSPSRNQVSQNGNQRGNQGNQGSQGSNQSNQQTSNQSNQQGSQSSSQSNQQVSQSSSQSSQIGSIGGLGGLGSIGGLGGLGGIGGLGGLGGQDNIITGIAAAGATAGATSIIGDASGASTASGSSGAASGANSSSGAASGANSSSGAASGANSPSGAASGASGANSPSGAASGASGASGANSSSSDANSNSNTNTNSNTNANTDYNTQQYDDTQYDDQQYEDTQDTQYDEGDGDGSGGGSSRIYNPIDYKSHYRGDMRFRPNVCSYGTKQITQPIFLNSSTLFQGTDLKEAAENTQVGSIMPKFEYYEYEDTR